MITIPLEAVGHIIFVSPTRPVGQNKKIQTMRNKVQLIGNLGGDPEIKTLNSGKKMAKLNIATNEIYFNDKGEKVTETQWHNLVAWNKQAEKVEKYLTKGQELVIEGRLNNRSYEDKSGQKKYITEIVVDEFLMAGRKKEE